MPKHDDKTKDRCPNCGYCRHCGQSKHRPVIPAPYPVPTPVPYRPWPRPYPWGEVTYGGGNIAINRTAPNMTF